MTLNEKVAYLKGLIEGYEIKDNTKEGKIIKTISDILEDMALSVTDLEDDYAELRELTDEIDKDLTELEDEVYGGEDDDEDEDEIYEVECPHCGEKVYVDEDAFDGEEIACPNCGENFEIDDICECCEEEEQEKQDN